jgi:hypothetical protein
MKPGELVFFWVAGQEGERGLHGWGRIVSEPYKEAGDFRVDVRLECCIEPHIRASVVHADPVLRDHPIFTVRVGSNFLLDDDAVPALVALIPAAQRPELAHL